MTARRWRSSHRVVDAQLRLLYTDIANRSLAATRRHLLHPPRRLLLTPTNLEPSLWPNRDKDLALQPVTADHLFLHRRNSPHHT